MSLNIALSGINAANADLSVTSDNIANANTTGFKKSRAEFSDLVNTLSPNREGLGVRLQGITQTFTQGTIENTGRTFDMAIVGDGFFQVRNDQGISYTRAGNFTTALAIETVAGQEKTATYVVDNLEQRVQGFIMQDYPPQPTTEVRIDLTLQNLDIYGTANALENDPVDFDPDNPLTYNHQTAVEVIDSYGTVHRLNTYFLHTPAAPPTYDSHTWQVFHQLDNRPAIDGGTVTFDGTLTGAIAINNLQDNLTFSSADLGANPATLTINLKDTTNPGRLLSALPIGSTDGLREGTQFTVDRLTANGALATQRLSDDPRDLVIDATTQPPRMTQQALFEINLNASEKLSYPVSTVKYTMNLDGSTLTIDPLTDPFDPDNPATYTLSNQVAVYDRLGAHHLLNTYLVHTGGDEWNVYYRLDGTTVKAGQNTGDVGLGFNGILGEIDPLISLFTPAVVFTAAELGSGAPDLAIAPDFGQVRQLIGDGTGTDLSKTERLLATAPSADVTTFNAADTSAYHAATALVIYDSLGIDHVLNLYFRKITDNTWSVYQQAPDISATASKVGSLIFDSRGLLVAAQDWHGISDAEQPTSFNIIGLQFSNGAARQNIQLNFADATQFDSQFVITRLEHDGYTMGTLTGVELDETGLLTANYSNGQVQIRGQVALAVFENPQGLKRIGDNRWSMTLESGSARIGRPGEGRLGQLVTGALEGSNVELTSELVDMITAQRNFQANAQVISTTGALHQALLNIR